MECFFARFGPFAWIKLLVIVKWQHFLKRFIFNYGEIMFSQHSHYSGNRKELPVVESPTYLQPIYMLNRWEIPSHVTLPSYLNIANTTNPAQNIISPFTVTIFCDQGRFPVRLIVRSPPDWWPGTKTADQSVDRVVPQKIEIVTVLLKKL